MIRHVLPDDLDGCYLVEVSGFPAQEAATRETIKLRMDTFPEGFLVATGDYGGAVFSASLFIIDTREDFPIVL